MRNGPYELVIAPPEYPGKKYRGRYCYEHHLVYWQNTGIIPGAGQLVHHKNHRKRDNRFENLELQTIGEHAKHHGKARRGPIKHGTNHAYAYRKCRCRRCKEWRRQAQAEYRARTGKR